MKKLKYGICLMCLALSAVAQEHPTGLPELPGAEYRDGTVRRKMRALTAEDKVEGSPIWIVLQVIGYSKAMDFDSLAKLQSAAQVKGAKQNTPEQMDALVGGILLDDTVQVGDSKEEGNRCYVYLTFKREDGRKRSFYSYFLKVEGRWWSVTAFEWQRGELEAVN